MDKILVLNYEFKSVNGTNIDGQMHFPVSEGIIGKPIKVIVSGGQIDLSYRNNSGASSQLLRDKKDELLKNNCEERDTDLYAYVKTPFVLSDKSTGLVKVMSILNGYNSNREGLLYFNDFKGMKGAKLFQNLKDVKISDAAEYIKVNEAPKDINEKIRSIIMNYEKNIKTASAEEVEVKDE